MHAAFKVVRSRANVGASWSDMYRSYGTDFTVQTRANICNGNLIVHHLHQAWFLPPETLPYNIALIFESLKDESSPGRRWAPVAPTCCR